MTPDGSPPPKGAQEVHVAPGEKPHVALGEQNLPPRIQEYVKTQMLGKTNRGGPGRNLAAGFNPDGSRIKCDACGKVVVVRPRRGLFRVTKGGGSIKMGWRCRPDGLKTYVGRDGQTHGCEAFIVFCYHNRACGDAIEKAVLAVDRNGFVDDFILAGGVVADAILSADEQGRVKYAGAEAEA